MTDKLTEVPEKAGKTPWAIMLFFALLIAMNATFFAIAFDNPPEMHPSHKATPTTPAEVEEAPATDDAAAQEAAQP